MTLLCFIRQPPGEIVFDPQTALMRQIADLAEPRSPLHATEELDAATPPFVLAGSKRPTRSSLR
jgi:hypothetical protein